MIEVVMDQLIPDVLREFFSEPMVERMLDDAAELARSKWIALAREELDTTSADYIDGIQQIESEPGLRTIRLVGWLPNAVENGISAYDMRKTLLGPGKGKVNAKGGRYRSIPFRHRTQGATGNTFGSALSAERPQGSRRLQGPLSAGAAQHVGRAIYDRAKRLTGSATKGPGTATAWGGRLPAGLVPRIAEHHKTDIYAGMVRVRQTYKAATQSQYRTFRTISESETDGWQHPGITPHRMAQRVDEYVRQQIPGILKNTLKAFDPAGGG